MGTASSQTTSHKEPSDNHTLGEDGESLQASDLEQQLADLLKRTPPILRLPPPKGRCQWSAQSRSSLWELVAPCERNGFKPPVQAIYKRSHKYAQRGQWLIPAENLFRYLLGLSATTSKEYADAMERRASRASINSQAAHTGGACE